jgi:Trypsin
MARLRPHLVLLLLSGCAGDATPMAARAILGGDPSSRMATAQTVKPATTICSASVIAPRVIVTAKHCLGAVRDDPGVFDGFEIWTRRVLDASYHYKVIAGRTTAGNDLTEDVAVMVVDRDFDLMGDQPYPVRRDLSGLAIGDSTRLVGWGDDGTGKAGTRLETVDTISSLDDQFLDTMGRGACKGDSGGSALDPDGRLTGVMIQADCAGFTRSERIDRYLDLVDWAFETSGVCVPKPEVCGNGKDDDCDGVIDQGCGGDAGACADPRACGGAPGGCAIGGRGRPAPWLALAALLAIAGSGRRRSPCHRRSWRPRGRSGRRR